MNSQPDELRQERMAPHSVESEEAILGSIIMNPDTLHDVIGFLKPDDFFIVRNQWVYEAFLSLNRQQMPIDYTTVCEELRHQERLEEIGGMAYITYLLNHMGTWMYAEAYGRLVQRAAIRRRMLSAASDIAQLAHDETLDIEQVLSKAEASLSGVRTDEQSGGLVPMRVIASETFDMVARAMEQETVGITTGLTDLDQILGGGMQASDLITLAGRPGMGKTSLLMTIARNAYLKGNAKVAVFSLEMSAKQLNMRLTSMQTGINTKNLRNGKLTEVEHKLFVEANADIATWNIYIDDAKNLSPWQLVARCERMKNRYGLDLVVVDYLQLMNVIAVGSQKAARQATENRNQEIGLITRTLKQLAGELDVPVLAASQLSRAVENRADKRPTLADLRDSGSIEQDSDVVIFVYRDEVYNEDTERPNQADLIIEKQRNGPTGTVCAYFRKELTEFANLRRTDVDLAGF